MRIDPKLRYLTDLAVRASGKSLTDYIESALMESFKHVSLDQFPELSEEPNFYELTPAERQERFRKRDTTISSPLSDSAERLWSEHPFVRVQLLVLSGLDHLMSEDDKAVWNYLFTRPELKTQDGKLKMKLISQQWERIKSAALANAKTKGRKP
jgi:hypothetical protein